MNPLLPLAQAVPSLLDTEREHFQSTRDKLLAIFKLILNGDQLAADYLLLCLLSKVHSRKDCLLLGNLPINLSNVN